YEAQASYNYAYKLAKVAPLDKPILLLGGYFDVCLKDIAHILALEGFYKIYTIFAFEKFSYGFKNELHIFNPDNDRWEKSKEVLLIPGEEDMQVISSTDKLESPGNGPGTPGPLEPANRFLELANKLLERNHDVTSYTQSLGYCHAAVEGTELRDGAVIPGYVDIIENDNYSPVYKDAARNNLKLACLKMVEIYRKLSQMTKKDYTQEILSCYDEALKYNFEDLGLHAELALFYLVEEQQTSFFEELKYLSKTIEGTLKLGWVYLNCGKFKEAQNEAHAILSEDPENTDAHYLLMSSLIAMDKTDNAIRVAEYIIDNAPLDKKIEIVFTLLNNFDNLKLEMLYSKRIRGILQAAVKAYPYQEVFGKLLLKLGWNTKEDIEQFQKKQRNTYMKMFTIRQALSYWVHSSLQATWQDRVELVFKVYGQALDNGIRGSPESLISFFRTSYCEDHRLWQPLEEIEERLKEKLTANNSKKIKVLTRLIQAEISNSRFQLNSDEKNELARITDLVIIHFDYKKSIGQKIQDITGNLFSKNFLNGFILLILTGIIWQLINGASGHWQAESASAFILPLFGIISSRSPNDPDSEKTGVSLPGKIANIKLGPPEGNIVKVLQPSLFDTLLRVGLWDGDILAGEFILRRDKLENKYVWVEDFQTIEEFKNKRGFYYYVGLLKITRYFSWKGFIVEEVGKKLPESQAIENKIIPLPGQLTLRPGLITSEGGKLKVDETEEFCREIQRQWQESIKVLRQGLKPLRKDNRIDVPYRNSSKMRGTLRLEIRVRAKAQELYEGIKWNAAGNELLLTNERGQDLIITLLVKSITRKSLDTVWVGDTEYALIPEKEAKGKVLLKKIQNVHKDGTLVFDERGTYLLDQDAQGRVALDLTKLADNAEVKSFFGMGFGPGSPHINQGPDAPDYNNSIEAIRVIPEGSPFSIVYKDMGFKISKLDLPSWVKNEDYRRMAVERCDMSYLGRRDADRSATAKTHVRFLEIRTDKKLENILSQGELLIIGPGNDLEEIMFFLERVPSLRKIVVLDWYKGNIEDIFMALSGQTEKV
ncbi:MAG: tetratricopeptide repeat protein, partial [Candidatus Omnitrophota bacterium]